MEQNIDELVSKVYAGNYNSRRNFLLNAWLNNNNIRYYSLGRYALRESLKLLKIRKGDLVAVPEFICRDLLASVASVGAAVLFYPVNKSLNISTIPKEIYQAKAIVVVNYFGFPQDLDKFKEVADKSKATLIEDNAHGFLSRDISGRILGTRTPLGIFSLRKTIPLLNGAALVANDSSLSEKLPLQVDLDVSDIPFRIKLKKTLSRLVPFIGVFPCKLMILAARMVRKIYTGSEIPIPDYNAEIKIPGKENPCHSLYDDLSMVDTLTETSRRRGLYMSLDKDIREYGGEPIFDELTDGVVPYGFPFRANSEQLINIKKYLDSISLECNRWPDLPDDLVEQSKIYYRNVWMVPFLW